MTPIINKEPESGEDPLRRMNLREDVLEICYWYQGEGFGDRFSAQSLKTFLNSTPDAIVAALERLADEGALMREGASYVFTPEGKKQAGRLFHETFADFQVGTHGECTAGCCESEGDGDQDRGRPGNHPRTGPPK
jgi:hypothetical protein